MVLDIEYLVLLLVSGLHHPHIGKRQMRMAYIDLGRNLGKLTLKHGKWAFR
jgi:hypothetical protein